MRRSVLALTLAAVAATAAACGSGSTPDKAMAPAGETASPMAAPTSAMPTEGSISSSAGMDSQQDAGMGPQIPQITARVSAMGMGMSMVPQGRLGSKAVAAGMGRDHSPVVTVTASDTGCLPDKVTVTPGHVWFKVVNHGMAVSALFLETTKGKELIEVAKVAHGAYGGFRATVRTGNYLIACQPGKGNVQVRTPLKVAVARSMAMQQAPMNAAPMSSAPMSSMKAAPMSASPM